MAHINQLASLTTAPVIYSLGKGPRDLLLSESLNAQLEKFGMACVRLTDADGQLLTIEAATAEALSWENLRRPQPHFLAANDPLFGSKDWSYHGSPFGDMQLLTIKSSHPGLPVDLRHPHWLFEVPASKERKVEKKKQQQSNKMNGAKKRKVSDATAGNGSDGTDGSDGGDGSSSTPPPVTPPPPCGPHVRSGEGRKHGVGYLNFSIILGDNYEVPAFEQLETHYRYCTAEEREEIFWKSRQWLTSAMVSSVPMPQSLATTELESHPWSVYHLGKQTELPIILNELLSSDWARAHPRSYIEPPYAGVLTPFLYHAAPMSFFPMHIEEYALPALNWLFSARRSFSHKTEPAEGRRDAVSADDEQQAGTEGGVAWYCCPGSSYGAVCNFASSYIDDGYRKADILAAPFSAARWLFNPVDLHDRGIPVTRFIQRPGDIMVTGPGALHWGVNLSVAVKVDIIPSLACCGDGQRERETKREMKCFQAAVNWASVKHWHPAARQIYRTMHERLHQKHGAAGALTKEERTLLLERDAGKKMGFSWIDEYDIDVFTR